MTFSLSILEAQVAHLREATLGLPAREGAAYLICGAASLDGETGLVVRDVVPVDAKDYVIRERDRLSIASPSYGRIMKRAEAMKAAGVVFVHSHPEGPLAFSGADGREEPNLMRFFLSRRPVGVYGTAVMDGNGAITARVWDGNGWEAIDAVRVVGPRLVFSGPRFERERDVRFFDRQVAAFGPDLQSILAGLTVGVVGVGGTGSAVAEQLVRLGVGRLCLFDGDDLEDTNLSRVYGSRRADLGTNKAQLAARYLQGIGLTQEIRPFGHITSVDDAQQLRRCDVVFGCTDKERPRSVLTRLALHYFIPVFDLGVSLPSEGGRLEGVYGRVTILYPGEACLFCRERITSERIALESKSPEERERLVAEGYAPELDTRAPAVITLTTAVAALATTEFIERLTGFMGSRSEPSELLVRFHDREITRNRRPAVAGCMCQERTRWGRADQRDFLGLTWPSG